MAEQGDTPNPAVVIEELVDIVAEMLAKRWHKHEIKSKIWEVLGEKCSPASVEKLMRYGRARLMKRTMQSLEDHKADAIGFY